MKKFIASLGLVVASTAFALVVFEIVLRVVGYSAPIWYQPDARLGWTLRPHAQGWFTREGRAYVRVNSAGQRDAEHSVGKPAGTYRVAVLGDSYAEARQVGEREAFWALLPERLAQCSFQRGKKIEVINFGVSGYGTAQEYLMLESTAMRYRPDLVLLQFTNGNDVMNNSLALEEEKQRPFYALDPRWGLRLDDSFAASEPFAKRSSAKHQLARRATDHSRVMQLAHALPEMAPMTRPQANAPDGAEAGLKVAVLAPPRERAWEEAWLVTERLIAKTHEFAERHGARLVLVMVPYAIQAHPDRKQRAEFAAKLGVADLFYPERRITEWAGARGIAALPLAFEMQRLAEASGAYFYGFENTRLGTGHWNVEGHRIAAELIARKLCGEPQ